MKRASRLNLADYFAIAFIVFLLIPQATILGRAMFSVGCFGAWLFFSMGARHQQTLRQCSPMMIALALQAMIYLLKSVAADSFEFLKSVSTGFVIMVMSLYLCSHYILHFPYKLAKIRAWGLIGVAACVFPAIVIVWQQPGIGRLLVSQDPELVDHLRWQGVPSYYLIYTVSMCLFVFLDLLGRISGITRLLLVIAIGVLFIHVALSTLALPTFLLVAISIVASIQLLMKRPLKAILAMFVLCMILVFMSLTSKSIMNRTMALPQIERIVLKFEAVGAGVTEKGLEEGDETGRGEKMIDSFETFTNNPLLGRSFSSRAQGKIGGHSSLVDPLAMFGALGYIPMWYFHYLVIRQCIRYRSSSDRRAMWMSPDVLAWCFYGVASFWNPTTFTVLPFAILFLTVGRTSSSPVTEQWAQKKAVKLSGG